MACALGRVGQEPRPRDVVVVLIALMAHCGQMGRCRGNDVFQTVCHARERPAAAISPGPHGHAGTMGATARPYAFAGGPFPAAGRTTRASPPGHAALRPFSARTPICWRPPPGCTKSATPPASRPPACTSSSAPGTCATPSTPMPCCADWSLTTPAPSSRPTNADSPMSLVPSPTLHRTSWPAC